MTEPRKEAVRGLDPRGDGERRSGPCERRIVEWKSESARRSMGMINRKDGKADICVWRGKSRDGMGEERGERRVTVGEYSNWFIG